MRRALGSTIEMQTQIATKLLFSFVEIDTSRARRESFLVLASVQMKHSDAISKKASI